MRATFNMSLVKLVVAELSILASSTIDAQPLTGESLKIAHSLLLQTGQQDQHWTGQYEALSTNQLRILPKQYFSVRLVPSFLLISQSYLLHRSQSRYLWCLKFWSSVWAETPTTTTLLDSSTIAIATITAVADLSNGKRMFSLSLWCNNAVDRRHHKQCTGFCITITRKLCIHFIAESSLDDSSTIAAPTITTTDQPSTGKLSRVSTIFFLNKLGQR